MANPKPKFDPSKPFEAGAPSKPKFDPSKPFDKFSPPSFVRGQREADEMTAGDRLLTGIGGGMVNIGRNVADIAGRVPGLEGIRPNPAEWADERKAQRYITDTPAGEVGNFVGETAALLPLGMGAGAPLRAGLARVAPAVMAAPAALSLRGVAGPALRALPRAVEGLVSGYTQAGPQNRNLGGGIGAAANVALPPLFSAGGRIGYRGLIKASDAAKRLMAQGVDKLTLGQMAPRSMLAQFEEAGTSSGAGGDILRAQRQNAIDQWQDVVLDKARAPGSEHLAEGDSVPHRLQAAYEGYGPAYAPIKSAPIPADMGGVSMRQAMNEGFHAAAEDPAIMAPQATRDMVGRFLQNQATVLDKVPVTPWPSSPRLNAGQALPRALGLPANAGPNTGTLVPTQANPLASGSGIVIPPKPVIPGMRGSIPAEALMSVRGNIRKEVAKQLAGGSPDYTAAELLGNSEKMLSDALETHLPEDAAQTLRGVDAAYSQYKRVADAVRRAGDAPDSLRPTHLSAAIKSATEGDAYARGAGGPLRSLAADAREVFDTRVPMTGARYLTAGPASWITSPLAAVANTQSIKKALTGNLGLQKLATAAEEKLLRQEALARALRMTAAQQFVPKQD